MGRESLRNRFKSDGFWLRSGWLLVCLLMLLMACGGGSSSGGNPDDPGGGGTVPDDDPVPIDDAVSYQWDPADFTHVYEVGPGRPYADPNEVPWESLAPSSLVRIYYRDTPYQDKWVINVSATADAPVVVLGVADAGRRPVITGEDATTRQALDYWNEERSVIKIGGSSLPDNAAGPAYIYVQGLDIRCARPDFNFTDDSGQPGTYSENAAAIHVEAGDAIFIQDCILHEAGNGLFSGSASSRLTISGNFIHGNGIAGSIYHHNSYTESQGIIFQFNHYGPLGDGCLGNNLKDRSSGTVIRYNWIESGNRQLDLVETDYDFIANDPSYDATFVYGNVLIEPEDAGNSQILHYGGDGGDEIMYRRGTLYFYHNTVVSTRSGNTTLVRLSTTEVQAQVFDNILFVSATGDRLAITSGNGQTALFGNWLPAGWQVTHEGALEPGAAVTDEGNVEGDAPGFVDAAAQDFRLVQDAEARDAAATPPVAAGDHPVAYQYVKHQQYETRPTDGAADIGAMERAP
jgi:hypothetical protein